MRGNRKTDSKPEVLLRSHLHRRGLRFRKNVRLIVGGLAVRPDIVFPRARLAVFVDGCFWHKCPLHGVRPRSNPAYWNAKLGSNVARDATATAALEETGWHVVRVWEHVPSEEAAIKVASALNEARRPVSA
jgi:DNA mismatch endonuclease (patch repair protein)